MKCARFPQRMCSGAGKCRTGHTDPPLLMGAMSPPPSLEDRGPLPSSIATSRKALIGHQFLFHKIE